MELDIDPENPNPDPVTGLVPQVEWVRYHLAVVGGAATSTLFRTVSPKIAGGDPTANPSAIPFVENVVQDPNQVVGPNNPAVFVYECDRKRMITPGVCLVQHIKTVYITLQVQGNIPDIKTGQFQRITVQGAASRLNPSP